MFFPLHQPKREPEWTRCGVPASIKSGTWGERDARFPASEKKRKGGRIFPVSIYKRKRISALLWSGCGPCRSTHFSLKHSAENRKWTHPTEKASLPSIAVTERGRAEQSYCNGDDFTWRFARKYAMKRIEVISENCTVVFKNYYCHYWRSVLWREVKNLSRSISKQLDAHCPKSQAAGNRDTISTCRVYRTW